MRSAEICCSQSDTSFYQSVFAEHVTKIRVRFFRSKHTASDSIIEFYVLQGTFQLSRGTHEVEHKHVDDNEDTFEDDVPETNVRKFVGVTDIVKIVREKKSVFGFYRGKQVMATRNDSDDVWNSQSRTCKECEKKHF